MVTTDSRIDAYIERAAPFARPILEQLRSAVHTGCPGCTETIKWGMPFFLHGDGILGHMAAFKQHCAFGLWKGRGAAERDRSDDAMGQFGRIVTLADLPPKRELVQIVRQAAALIDASTPTPRAPKGENTRAPPEVPAELLAAFKRDAAIRRTFAEFSPTHRREYIEWIDEAKRAETRARRVAHALEWLAEGKTRYWKHLAR